MNNKGLVFSLTLFFYRHRFSRQAGQQITIRRPFIVGDTFQGIGKNSGLTSKLADKEYLRFVFL